MRVKSCSGPKAIEQGTVTTDSFDMHLRRNASLGPNFTGYVTSALRLIWREKNAQNPRVKVNIRLANLWVNLRINRPLVAILLQCKLLALCVSVKE